jgi:uncharacterized phosphosugar-binding protein
MDAIGAYFDNMNQLLEKVIKTQKEAIHTSARHLCEATLGGYSIFTFGCSHASLLALELYYRTGGLMTINPVRAPGLNLDVDPATMTSQIERLPEYGRIIAENQPIRTGDVVIIHSVSGRNTVTVDFALRARELGAKVIALTSLETSNSVRSRHPSGKRLHEIADLVLDNCGCCGDASLDIPGVPERVAPTSTAVGAVILNAMVAQTVALIAESGHEVPVFISANLDGGDEHNQAMLKKYRDHIFYMGH